MERPLLYPMGEASLRPRPAPVASAASDKPPRWRAPERADEALRAADITLRAADGDCLEGEAPRPVGEALRAAGEDELLAAALRAPEEESAHSAYAPEEEEGAEAVPTSQMPTPVCVPLDEAPFAPRRRVWPWVLGAALCALLGLGWRLLHAAG